MADTAIEWAALPDGGLVKFAAAKLERYERERARAREGLDYAIYGDTPEPDVMFMVEALRDLARRLDDAPAPAAAREQAPEGEAP